eukprot:gene22738-1364_t
MTSHNEKWIAFLTAYNALHPLQPERLRSTERAKIWAKGKGKGIHTILEKKRKLDEEEKPRKKPKRQMTFKEMAERRQKNADAAKAANVNAPPAPDSDALNAPPAPDSDALNAPPAPDSDAPQAANVDGQPVPPADPASDTTLRTTTMLPAWARRDSEIPDGLHWIIDNPVVKKLLQKCRTNHATLDGEEKVFLDELRQASDALNEWHLKLGQMNDVRVSRSGTWTDTVKRITDIVDEVVPDLAPPPDERATHKERIEQAQKYLKSLEKATQRVLKIRGLITVAMPELRRRLSRTLSYQKNKDAPDEASILCGPVDDWVGVFRADQSCKALEPLTADQTADLLFNIVVHGCVKLDTMFPKLKLAVQRQVALKSVELAPLFVYHQPSLSPVLFDRRTIIDRDDLLAEMARADLDVEDEDSEEDPDFVSDTEFAPEYSRSGRKSSLTPEVLQHIKDCIALHTPAADGRRRDEVDRVGTTVPRIQNYLKTKGHNIAEQTLRYAFAPPNSRLTNARRYRKVFDVRPQAPANSEKKDRLDSHHCASQVRIVMEAAVHNKTETTVLSVDCKAVIPLGIEAVSHLVKAKRIVEQGRLTIPDHVYGSTRNIKPLVILNIDIREDDTIEDELKRKHYKFHRNGSLYVRLRPSKFVESNSLTHANDVEHYLDRLPSIDPALVLIVDNGRDIAPSSLAFLLFLWRLFISKKLDVLVVASFVGGHSAYNPVERKMVMLSKRMVGEIHGQGDKKMPPTEEQSMFDKAMEQFATILAGPDKDVDVDVVQCDYDEPN